ncbi:SDR family oxidoreductase [Streptomyces sp. NPDC003011]
MTKHAGTRAVVVGEASDKGLAIATRLVEGGAEVLPAARTPRERVHRGGELGSAARVVAPAALEGCLGPGDDVDLLFAGAVSTARPLLPEPEGRRRGRPHRPRPSPAPVHAHALALATELVSHGVRVNAVAPGCIEGPGGDAVPLPPPGRLGAAEEMARAALFLATDATFTTGARLPVDGGRGQP